MKAIGIIGVHSTFVYLNWMNSGPEAFGRVPVLL